MVDRSRQPFLPKNEFKKQKKEEQERALAAALQQIRGMRVAIVGAGLAGLAAAITLLQNGCRNVTVYERDRALDQRRQGYGLTILQVGATLM